MGSFHRVYLFLSLRVEGTGFGVSGFRELFCWVEVW